MLPALTDKPFNSGDNSPRNEDVLQNNPKRNKLENSERNAFENLNLEDNLTVVLLDRSLVLKFWSLVLNFWSLVLNFWSLVLNFWTYTLYSFIFWLPSEYSMLVLLHDLEFS